MPFSLPEGVTLTWLGHSTFLVETPAGKRVLIDPWVQNNPACPDDKKDVGPVDLMLVTHGHYDHIEDAIPIAQATRCRVVGIYELVAWLMRHGVGGETDGNVPPGGLMFPMNKGGSLRFDDLGLTVTMVHADHSCGIKDGDQIVYGGEAVGYVVTVDTPGDPNGFTFYHAGDTAGFSDMGLIADLYRPTLALLPVGDRFVMSPREAARAAQFLSPSVQAVVPMHFGTFPLLTGTPEATQDELAKAGANVELITLAPGQTLGNKGDGRR